MRRRRFLGTLAAGGATTLVGCLGDDDPTPTPSATSTPTDDGLPPAIDLDPVATGIEAPTDLVFLPDGERALLATQPGRVYLLEGDGLHSEPVLDLGDRLVAGGERGLLGLAVHPETAQRLFVRYSAPSRSDAPSGFSHTFVCAEFELDDDRRRADPATERSVIEIDQPQANHNSGVVLFGPDGYLYLATGDGGGAGDAGPGHVEDWYDANAGGNGQDTTENLLGGILRLDVDHPDAPGGYAIPPDNPLVDEPDHLDEHYAWGLRNPWGASFDEGRFFVGDVGQVRREEVNLVEAGGNYGWNVREGRSCFDTAKHETAPSSCPDRTPAAVRGGEPLLDPIVEYPNTTPEAGSVTGVAVVGGAVYRGDAIPGLEGRYVFGDYLPSGRLFVARPAEDPAYPTDWVATTLSLTEAAAGSLEELRGFARDGSGELYAFGGGDVFALRPA
ncbi:MAG: PQQ-dependent sugar dehydrogenase [Halobacteriales archaeon]